MGDQVDGLVVTSPRDSLGVHAQSPWVFSGVMFANERQFSAFNID